MALSTKNITVGHGKLEIGLRGRAGEKTISLVAPQSSQIVAAGEWWLPAMWSFAPE